MPGKGRELETTIRISGELDKSIRKALDAVSDNMDEMEKKARQAGGQVGELSGKISDQSKVLEIAKKKYASYILSGDKGSKQAKTLKKDIKRLSSELKGNTARLDAAEKAANELAEELDDVGDAAKDTKGGFTIMKGAAANLVSTGIQKLIDKAGEAITTIYGLSESTREYREDISKLETAFETAKLGVKAGTKVYKELFSVFGEEDRAVEAAQQIAALAKNENEMTRMTRIATGAWAKWGDSLATESLMEATNSTAKIGEVQGTLADALEWCGVNLEAYNEKLAGLSTEEERKAAILNTLDNLYSESAKNYRKNNASIIDARLAQSDYNDTLAAMGEKVEPATVAVQRNLNKVLTKALELADKIDFSEVAEQIDTLTDKAFDLAKNGLGKLKDGIQLVKDNADWLLPVVSGLTAGFVTYKAAVLACTIASKAAAVAEGIKIAVLATGATTVSAATVATWALNSALAVLTSPITLVVAAIAALVAAGVWMYKNWDVVKEKAAQLGEFLSGVWSGIKESVGNFIGGIKESFATGFQSLVGIIKKPINAVIGIINGAISGINSIGFDIPDWVPKIGGQKFSLNIPELPMLATGGFTNGVSIAGEKAREAVISFDPAYRSQNLSYWAEAGRMLGADYSDYVFGGSSSDSYYDMGGVTFAPNITIHGEAKKENIMEAIEAEYPEFLDLLEAWFNGRGDPVYG